MNGMVNSPLASAAGVGFTVKQVTVQQFDSTGSRALCVDSQGAVVEVMVWLRRVVLQPQVGDVWLVDRQLGVWTFAAIVSAAFPATPWPNGPWTPLTLQQGWTAASPPDAPPSARVTADGWVELSGVMAGGTVPAPGNELTVATLPTGVQLPAFKANRILACQLVSGIEYVKAALYPTGTITLSVPAAMTPYWVDLGGLRARAI